MTGLLHGITVLELGQVIAGTYAGTILADLGAEVIKIEPLSGDANRNPGIAPLASESAIHLFMNRNKKSVSLDLKSPEGHDLFCRLAEQAAIVIDNFRPGVLTRLGIDHQQLTKRNPGIVTVSVTGFGEYGPQRDRPAFDLAVQAFAGYLHVTGDPDGPPARMGIPLADLSAGVFACISALAGLAGRLLHGEGAHADVAMLDCLVSLLSYDALDHLNTGRQVTRQGTAHAHMVPWQASATRNGYLVIAVREDKFWRRLCDAIGLPRLKADPRTATNPARVANRELVTGLLRERFARRDTGEWLRILSENDIPAAPVNDLPAVFADEQVTARGLVRTYHHPVIGDVRYPANPPQFDGWAPASAPAPQLGEHTEQVLLRRLGMRPEQIADLARRGVVRVRGSSAAPAGPSSPAPGPPAGPAGTAPTPPPGA
ncbi:MAG: CoA transferase [Nocardiopsaceae bacterium]|jgi:crotonobetainyl-CoA:carnitine CoA-transferase CaiB-like acyl-CoA transferase|nr:CoA transferase [Nocardiopsaceae bacterium]